MTKLKFKKKILDDVHGIIYLTENEFQLTQLPIFQRLRNLKQLGISERVFPGTVHNRFSHSLGVMHIIDKMASNVKYVNCEKEDYLTIEDIKILRYAALLHDIGHYPLSHIGESAYQNIDTINLDDSTDLLKENNKKLKEKHTNLLANRTEKYLHHENVSGVIVQQNKSIKEILQKDFKKNIDAVLSIISKMITGNSFKVDSNNNTLLIDYKVTLLTQFLHSELDADRLDYLLRDSKEAGTKFGSVDLDYLFANLKIVKYKEEKFKNDKGEYPLLLCLNYSAIATADQFLVNRFYSYNNVVFNDKVLYLNTLAQYVLKYFIQNPSLSLAKIMSPKTLKDTINDRNEKPSIQRPYLLFDDSSFWQLLHNLDDSESAPRFLKSIIEKILRNKNINSIDTKEITLFTRSPLDFWEKVNRSGLLDDDEHFNIHYSLYFTKCLKKEEIIARETQKIEKDKKEAEKNGQSIENYDAFLEKNIVKAELESLFEYITILCADGQIKQLVDIDSSLISQIHDLSIQSLRCYTLK